MTFQGELNKFITYFLYLHHSCRKDIYDLLTKNNFISKDPIENIICIKTLELFYAIDNKKEIVIYKNLVNHIENEVKSITSNLYTLELTYKHLYDLVKEIRFCILMNEDISDYFNKSISLLETYNKNKKICDIKYKLN